MYMCMLAKHQCTYMYVYTCTVHVVYMMCTYIVHNMYTCTCLHMHMYTFTCTCTCVQPCTCTMYHNTCFTYDYTHMYMNMTYVIIHMWMSYMYVDVLYMNMQENIYGCESIQAVLLPGVVALGPAVEMALWSGDTLTSHRLGWSTPNSDIPPTHMQCTVHNIYMYISVQDSIYISLPALSQYIVYVYTCTMYDVVGRGGR